MRAIIVFFALIVIANAAINMTDIVNIYKGQRKMMQAFRKRQFLTALITYIDMRYKYDPTKNLSPTQLLALFLKQILIDSRKVLERVSSLRNTLKSTQSSV
ncbi:hypothetical protein PPYR_12796 [Photinus pyralis]|uniref:Uncharacterized protein n=1 Tax=Photinus pyralis TaxID=7054 RepID=A0A5N4A770_PHOPY|nr:hypothetical protein PPYR_12796 [Photinus pyralis]